MDHEGEELSKLKSFDSNIEIHDSLKTFSKDHVKLLIDRRLKDIESDCLDDDLDKLQTFNLLSFFYFAVNKQDEALSYNNQAREIDGRNINAVVCLAYYHLQWKNYFECDEVCKTLLNLQPTKKEKLLARAEVAYAYTKIGIRFYQKAVDKYQEVLKQNIEIPDNYVCSWKFSMALAIRRQINISNCPSTTDYPAAETTFKKVEMLYKEIISMQGNTVNRFKARACVDLGLEIFYRREKIRQQSNTIIESCDSRKYIKQALLLEPDDDFVLSRSGKYFRLIKQRTQAIKLLTKALQKKETSFAHHHLALALRDQICQNPRDKDEKTDIEYSGPSRQNAIANVCEDDQRTLFDKSYNQTSEVLEGRTYAISKLKHRQNRSSTRLDVSSRNTTMDTEQNLKYSPQKCFMRKLIKFPRELTYFPREKTKDICQHLDMAFRLNNNIGALYDKGLLLRSSRQYTEYMGVFKMIFGIEKESCSELQLANAYEQAALCLLEEIESMPSKQERNEYDAKLYLKKSIGISFDMVARIPGLEGCWQSFPTLRSLLQSKVQTKHTLREMADLSKRLSNILQQ